MLFPEALLALLLATLIQCVYPKPSVDLYRRDSLTSYTNNNLTSIVSWDPYSLIVNGERVFIFSAEFHYQRLPVPELWLDAFQKFKSQGFNTVSIYFFWYYHSAVKDEFDFESTGKNLQKLFDAAQEAGLWVIARAGPYCNAETNAGGLALYLGDGSGGKLRTSDDTYYQSWLPYVQNIGKIIAANQITNGGPVILNQIENELTETTHTANNTLVLYMEQVEQAFRDAGVAVPSTSNEKGERGMSWSTDFQNVGGAVDVYGLDSYPGGTKCNSPNSGYNVLRNYYQWFQTTSFTQPEFLPEFEGGYFQPWGGFNYDTCTAELSPNFPDLYYKNNIGQRDTLLNLYMGFGGTNWGHSGAPVVFTSYDYSAPLSEERVVRDKMKQTKLISLFTRVSQDLLITDMAGNGTSYATGANIWTWELRNPSNGAGFLVVQQNDTTSLSDVTFSLNFKTSRGNVTASNIELAGRQSKIVVTDYNYGSHKLLYSTADILTYASLGSDALALYLQEGQSGEFAFAGSRSQNSFQTYGTSNVSSSSSGNYTIFRYTQDSGSTALQFNDSRIIYLLNQNTAWNFHAPPLVSSAAVNASQHIFVVGPYLVRNVSIASSVVSVVGDTDTSTPIEVFAGNLDPDTISWNGLSLDTTRTPYGALTATIPAPTGLSVMLPSLTDWRTNDSLPERLPGYDDSKWAICNKLTTLSPQAPVSLPVLFSADYGFFAGQSLYRATFPTSAAPQSLNISAQHGLAAGWSAWLNGALVASYYGNATATSSSLIIPIASNSSSLLNTNDTDNLLFILVDYSGHDETSTTHGVENPRGLLGALPIPPLNSASTSNTSLPGWTWRIQGQAGGSSNSLRLDPARGPVNEGGLYGERLGWHLPGFDTSSWPSGSPLSGLNSSGLQWYTTDFNLSIPANVDIPLSLQLSNATADPIRVQIYVNGYQVGKFWPYLGPQTRFPVQPGVINTQGGNRLAVAMWAQSDAGGKLGEVELVAAQGGWESGFDFGAGGWGYLRPGWENGREEYA